jgi:hypothetical protein
MPSSLLLRLAPLAVLPCALLAALPVAGDPPPDAPAAPAAPGPVYKHAELGLTLTAPKGWTVAAEANQGSSWIPLAKLEPPGGQLVISVSRRPRTAAGLAELEALVKKDWAADKTLNVSAVGVVEPTTLRPVGMVRLEASQTRKTGPSRPGATPSPPVVWQYEAVYLLAAGAELRVQAEGPLAAFTPARAQIRATIDGLTLVGASRGAEGTGTYRDDLRGFAVKYPAGYGIVVPQRERHVVDFVPVSAEQPVLGVYLLSWEKSVSEDVERLIKHYKDERGGEATSRVDDVAGQPGAWITARVTENGRDTTILMALAKRGNDLFRLRAAMPQASTEAGTLAFKAFVASFTLSAPAR